MPTKPEDQAVEWPAESRLARLQACMLYLSLHGMLTTYEAGRVRERIMALGGKLAKGEK